MGGGVAYHYMESLLCGGWGSVSYGEFALWGVG